MHLYGAELFTGFVKGGPDEVIAEARQRKEQTLLPDAHLSTEDTKTFPRCAPSKSTARLLNAYLLDIAAADLLQLCASQRLDA